MKEILYFLLERDNSPLTANDNTARRLRYNLLARPNIMGETISYLTGLLPGAAAIEVSLIFLGVALWRLITPVVQSAIDDGLLHLFVAECIDVAFRIVLPVVLMVWFLSIPVRFLWIP